MSKYLLLGCILLIGIASLGVHATITFQYDTEQCLDQLIEYQCTVNAFALNWRVFDNNQTQLSDGFVGYNSGGIGPNATIGGGVLSVEQLQESPVISNISFTVQSSINGYTIVCEDGVAMTNENVTINIIDPPPSPQNDYIVTSFTETTAEVSWTEPSYSSLCYSIASYTINTNTSSSIITTTDTSTSIPLTGLSVGIYCISIASIDTANRIGTYSQQECFELTEPSELSLQYEAFNGTTDDNAIIRLSWTFDSTSFNPPLTATYLNISTESSYTITLLPASTTQYDITVMREINYSASIFGENIIGNGTINSIAIFVNVSEDLPIPPASSSSVVLSTTIPTTTIETQNDDFPIVPVVVPTVIIVVIIILIVITLVLALVIYKKKRSEQKPHPSSNTNKGSSMQMKPTGGNKQDTPADQTLYADLEVSTSKPPPSSSKKNVKPSTVEYSPVKHGVEYTELSHSQPVNRVGKKPDTIEPVNYSAVSHR